MLLAIQSEFNRLKKNTTLYLSLSILICMQILLTAIQIGLFEGSVNGISDPYILKLLWFTNTSILFSILFSIVLNYQVLSKEYSNKTWELLLLTIKNKNKVIFSKFIVIHTVQIICQILVCILFTIIVNCYYDLENNILLSFPFFLMSCLGNCFLSSCVFGIFLKVDNGMMAILCSIPLLLLPTFLGKLIFLGKYIPFMTVGYFLNISMNMNLFTNILLCLYNVMCGVILVYIVSKFFHL